VPAARLSMRTIRELLRLYAEQHLSLREPGAPPQHSGRLAPALSPDWVALAAAAGAGRRDARGRTLRRRSPGTPGAPAARLSHGARGAQATGRDASTPVARVQGRPPRRLSVHPVLRVLTAMAFLGRDRHRPGKGEHAAWTSGRRVARSRSGHSTT
jgi:hypothetical protein